MVRNVAVYSSFAVLLMPNASHRLRKHKKTSRAKTRKALIFNDNRELAIGF